MTDTDLTIPDLLRGPRPGPQPRRTARWARIKPRPRPEGERWETAERWECMFQDEVPNIACGLRRVWVRPGRLWCRISDGVVQGKVSMAVWRQLQKHGKEVQ